MREKMVFDMISVIDDKNSDGHKQFVSFLSGEVLIMVRFSESKDSSNGVKKSEVFIKMK